MIKSIWFATLACLAPAAHLVAQTPRDIVARGLEAMGGEPAVRALGGLSVSLNSAAFGLGQSELPQSPLRASYNFGQIVTDWRGMRRSTNAEGRAVTGATQQIRTRVVGDIGAQIVPQGTVPLAPGAVRNQQLNMRMSPDRLLLAAYDNPGALTRLPPRALRGVTHNGVRFAGTDTLTMYFDARSGLLTVIETVTDDQVLGDRVTQTWLTRWQPAGAIRFPRQLDILVNGQLWQHIVYTAVTADPPLPDSLFAIPDSVARRAQPAGSAPAAAPVTVILTRLAPSVWRAEGGSHHSLVVEQPGQLVVIEAPLSVERSRAVLDTLASRFPGKRVGTLVMTHYHWDHSGGVREYIAAGVPVVTLEENGSFVRGLASARRSVRPDLLARRPRPVTLRTFTDSMLIGSGAGQVVLYRTPNTHAEGVLSAWVGEARVLFTSDVLNPGATLSPVGSAELVALARARGLAPERYAGGHGAVTPWSDVEAAARR